ncbi:MAG: ROK family protein [Dehalococcoidia bacterium]
MADRNLMPAEAVVSIDLGATRLRTAVFGAGGVLLSRASRSTPPASPAALTEAAHEAVAAAAAAGRTVMGVAVGIAGPVHHATRSAPQLPNLPGWAGGVSATDLERSLALPVLIANDADLAALGEHRFGAGAGVTDMVYVTCSTGVGAGIILGGRLLRGEWSLAEIGRTLIDWRTGDTVEDLGSGTALARLAGAAGQDVEARARAGDREAIAQFRRVADAFAVGVLNLVYCFMPQRVVIGGGMAASRSLLLDPVRDRISQGGPSCPIGPADVVLAQRDDDAGLFGGYALWLDRPSA